MHHITTPWFLCLAKYVGSCSSEQLKLCLNWGVGAISLIFSKTFTFTPRFFIWLALFMYLKLTSTEAELTEFETSFCGSVSGDIQNLCLFVVSLAICHLLIPQKSIVKTYPCHSHLQHAGFVVFGKEVVSEMGMRHTAFWLVCIRQFYMQTYFDIHVVRGALFSFCVLKSHNNEN